LTSSFNSCVAAQPPDASLASNYLYDATIKEKFNEDAKNLIIYHFYSPFFVFLQFRRRII
jgi:hypothetical protein